MLTVIFSTHNGGELLRQVLESFTKVTAPTGGWALVAVDNASTDASFDVLNSFKERLPLSVLQHQQLGKNRALNVGLEKTQGDLIVFTDDDVFPEPDWLQQLRAAADAHPEFAIFGGSIVPHWESEPDPMLLTCVSKGVAYALTDASRPEGPVSGAFVWGPNMAVRASLFDAQGFRFNEHIGPDGGQYAMGSETEFNLRMEAAGHRCYFVPQAVVSHVIPATHLQRKWLMRRAYRAGRGEYMLFGITENFPGPTWGGVPRYLYGSLLRSLARKTFSGLSHDRIAAFRADWDFHRHLGIIAQARICVRERADRSRRA